MICIYINSIVHSDVDALNILLHVVAPDAPPLNFMDWKKIQIQNLVILARDSDDGDKIVGMATLAIINHPAGVHADLEDVAVSPHYQGTGIFHKLMEKVEQLAYENNAIIRFSCNPNNPSRKVALKAYTARGYEVRKTNMYEQSRKP